MVKNIILVLRCGNYTSYLSQDDTFSEDSKLADGDTVDISPDAADASVFIKVKADLGENTDGLNMIHIKQCQVS